MNRPNIILITCDELKQDSLSCYGNKAISTPHIDSIAESGTLYSNGYTVSPWCLPARCAILTGLYPHRSGAYSNFRKCPLDQGIPNIFTYLKMEGYRTALFGKCHFAPVPYGETRHDRTLPYDEFSEFYKSLGIDHLELQDDKQVSVWFYDDYSKELEKAGYLKAYRDCVWDKTLAKVFPFPAPAEYHPDAWVGSKASEYIENRGNEEPLFAWISFSGPHYPFDAPAEYYDRVDKSKLFPIIKSEGEFESMKRIHHKSYHGNGNIDGSNQAKDGACKNFSEEYWEKLCISYNANVALIDDKVGGILKSVQQRFGDNTLILFTADHGEMLGNHGLWGKHNCGYDDVWKIPFLVKYPFRVEPSINEAIVNLTDILPTCVQIARHDYTDSMETERPGSDGKPLFGENSKKGYDYTFAEGEGFIAVTDGKFKYIHVQKDNENFRELIDLQLDPHEFANCIDKPLYAPHLARLRGKIIEHFMPGVLP